MKGKRRIIKDSNNPNCKYSVQEYDEKNGWEFLVYNHTITIFGKEYDSMPYPLWYDTIEEAQALLEGYEVCDIATFMLP